MKQPHFGFSTKTELCKPRTHNRPDNDPTPIVHIAGHIARLAATVCAIMCMPTLTVGPANAQATDDILPSTREEILKDTIESQIDFQAARGNNPNQFCQIVLVNQGSLHEIPGTYSLSSKGAGGRPGVAQITTSNGSYRVSVDQPLGFMNAPAGGNSGVLMKASYNGYGSSNFSETPGDVAQKLKRGITTIEANLVAERTNSTPFPAGTYSAELTLRCE